MLNLSPDRRGLIPEKDRQIMYDFGRKIKEPFALKANAERTDSNGNIILKFDERPIALKSLRIVCKSPKNQFKINCVSAYVKNAF